MILCEDVICVDVVVFGVTKHRAILLSENFCHLFWGAGSLVLTVG